MTQRVTLLTPGLAARLHAGLISGVAHVARPFNYRGVQRVSWELTRFFDEDDEVEIRLSPDTRVILPLGDGYWTKLLNRHYVYEPELATALARLLDERTYFLDCGANIGYWSLLVRSRARRVVAVEANPPTYERLTRNAQLSEADIDIVNAALWNANGASLTIQERRREHAGASVHPSAGSGSAAHKVSSMTLDSLADRYCPDSEAPVIIKLDVEGAEIPALEGADDLLQRGSVTLLYEDHGGDPTCKVTEYLHRRGMVTADPISGAPLSLDEIGARKTHKWKGYNFLAYYPN